MHNAFLGYGGNIFDNMFVLCGLIFFIHVPDELYLQWLLDDIKYVDLCDSLAAGIQTITIKSQGLNFANQKLQRVFTTNVNVNYLQLPVLGFNIHVYN